jgi:cytochrome oxidase assembly protein ShyY1
MASALGWGAVAPFYIDLESPAPANGIPKPGPLQVHLRDDHMQYAITWFSLAALVAIAFGIWLDGKRRVG